jgi:hypothetical protein
MRLFLVIIAVAASLPGQPGIMFGQTVDRDSVAEGRERSRGLQTAWEYSPYAVSVWLAIDDPAELPEAAQAALCDQLSQLADAHIGAPWTLSARPVPASLRGELVASMDFLSAEVVFASEDNIEKTADKLMLIALARDDAQWRIAVRELDVATRQLSPAIARSAADDSALPQGVLQAVVDAFSPLVAVRRVEDDRVEGRLRAGGLADDKDSPILLSAGAPLVCVLRPEDRLGRARSGQVRVVPWTLLEVAQRDGAKVHCQVHSAQHKPLASRTSLRVKRFALAVRPAARPTELTLQTPGESATPLVDYELVEQDAKSQEVSLLGRTNQQGRVEIPPAAAPFRLLYVRHGDRVLARLPIIPGWQGQVTAPINSDDARLAAAAFIATLRQEIVDTVARRQILAARLQRRIAASELDDAQKLLTEFQRLPTPHDFASRLQTAKPQFAGGHPRGQEHIDKLFADASEALRQYLDPQELDRLETQLAQAKAAQ